MQQVSLPMIRPVTRARAMTRWSIVSVPAREVGRVDQADSDQRAEVDHQRDAADHLEPAIWARARSVRRCVLQVGHGQWSVPALSLCGMVLTLLYLLDWC